MELSPYELVSIAGGFTVVGAIIGGVTGHYLGIVKTALDSRRIAGIKLREAFAEEIATLQRVGVKEAETCDLLQNAFVKHQIAVNEFMGYLSGTEVEAFSRAWVHYYGYSENGEQIDTEFFAKYFHHCDKEGREKAINNMKAILAFAEPPKLKQWHWLFGK